MRSIGYLLQKEFLQIFRNRGMLPIIFVLPIVQLLVLAFAADYEIRHLNVMIVDEDHSSVSRRIVSSFQGSPYFRVDQKSNDTRSALQRMLQDRCDLVLTIPPDFEKELVKEGKGNLQLLADAVNGSKAALSVSYATSILQDVGGTLMAEQGSEKPSGLIQVTYSNWYNPGLDYKYYMVPGILVALVTMIGAFLSAMNIVKEKEDGTIEQINVTPIRKYQFITGKLLPFWIIGLFELSFGLVLTRLVFHVPMVGSVLLIFLFAAIYLLGVLGMGLLISSFTDTQQQAMFITWFFIVIFLLMSGLFTPVESMPPWAQKLTYFNPIAYFIEIMRLVMLKGSGFGDVKGQFAAIALFAVLLNLLAVLNFRKRS